jgi:hypothetical protein
MPGVNVSSTRRKPRALRIWGRASILTALTFVGLCTLASAGNLKRAATTRSLQTRLQKPEDCKTPPSASNKSPSSAAKDPGQSKTSVTEPADSKSQDSASDDPMKVRFVLEERDIPGVSSECAKEQSDPASPQCQAEKTSVAAPQCERTSGPKHDLVLPASEKSGQQE